MLDDINVAAYGSWDSPITPAAITQDAKSFQQLVLDAGNVYWLEGRPSESGRGVIMKRDKAGNIEQVTPPINGGPIFNVRTRVHEYGGAPFTVKNGHVYFVNFTDQNLYVQHGTKQKPIQLTKWGIRFASLQVTKHGIIAIGEEHQNNQVNNFIALIEPETGETHRLTEGNDFYAFPAISPDETKIAWVEWSHPNMPWDTTDLYCADIVAGQLKNVEKIAGNGQESITEPRWTQENQLVFVSDRSNWWNLYRYDFKDIKPVYSQQAEFSGPAWVHGISNWTFVGDRILAKMQNQNGCQMLLINPKKGSAEKLSIEGSNFADVTATDDFAVMIRGNTNKPEDIVLYQFKEKTLATLANAQKLSFSEDYISVPQAIEFPSNGRQAKALYYPPKNKDYQGIKETAPPLLVKSHGGPTAQAGGSFDPRIQFWTSRGFAVVDVNYGGSTGYGREYRELLKGQWGIVDREDCENAALYLAKQGKADPNKLAIRGGSAGGYTTLCALTFGNVFKAGASYYGVSDLNALAKDTHKFESRYLDSLIGPYPQRKDLYDERSPINHSMKLNTPVIFFQGDEDEIVPLNQAQMMVDALTTQKIPNELIVYQGEQHGFRNARNIQDSLQKELAFYLRVFDNT